MHNSDRRSWLSGPKGPGADEGGMGDVAQRQLRVARYKEERRRQLATQFGARVADTSGSSSSEQQSTLSRVRTTKTSRLRAAATNTASDSGGHSLRVVQNGIPSTRSREAVQPARSSISGKGQTSSLGRRSGVTDRRAGVATSTTSSHSDREKASTAPGTTSDGSSSTASRREKDKSSKRKSNLNRSLTAEEVHPDDLHDDPSVRRRRRRAEQHVALGVLDGGLHPKVEQPRGSLQFHTPVKIPPARSELPKIPSQPRTSIQLTRTEYVKSPQSAPTSRLEHARSPHQILSSKSEKAKTSPVTHQSPWQEHSKSPQQLLGLRQDSPKSPSPQPRTLHSKPEVKSTIPARKSPSPPPKPKQGVSLSLYSDAPQPSRVSQKVDKLISMTEETVARLDRLTGAISPSENIPAMTRADSPRSWSGSPSRHPSSILKKKSLEEPPGSSGSGAIPVSILKRKTSQDEAGGPSLPVTFSPSVLEPSSKRQGILKKRSSLDESEVLRRRSYSPDMAGVEGEFRPILKNQRRLSMEELVRRTQSPDPVQPQSILKRKWSREDDASVEDRSAGSPEPQGILKRKSGASSGSSSSSTSPHVSIATAVILSVASDVLEDTVRPILKKKSSSEDKTTGISDSVTGDSIPPPKPILKKKSSADVDDLDQACQQPMKPILKSSRKSSSQDDASWETATSNRESPVRCLKLRSRSSDSTSGSESELVRPILKTPGDLRDRSASPRHKLSFCEQETKQDDVVLRRTPDGHRSRSPVTPRPGSVAERIMNMESFLGQATGAVPKQLAGSHRASRDRERFHTQPITLDELNASSRLESVRAFQRGVLERKQFGQQEDVTSSAWIASNGGEEPATFITPPTSPRKVVDLTSPIDMALPAENTTAGEKTDMEEVSSLCRSSSVVAKASMFAQLEEEMRRAAEEARSRRAAPGTKFRTRDASRFSTQPVTLGEVQKAAAQTSEPPSLHEGGRKQDTGEDEDEPSQLSLAERVKLFNKKSQEEAKPCTVVPKRRPVQSTRFKTQPVTIEEVETARHISPLAASLAKPPDPALLGGMSARAARDKMYEHGAAILTKIAVPSCHAPSKHKEAEDTKCDAEADLKPKGILKNLARSPTPGETAGAVSSDESEGEVKGILKTGGTPITSSAGTPELESFRHLKSVLKKETENQAPQAKSNASTENLRSILKRESTEWDESSSSSSESSESETDVHAPIRPLSVPVTRNTLDLVSILHGVEANARKQRQALVSAPNNNHEKAMNIRNLQHEKHEKENYAARQENCYVKQLDIEPGYKAVIKQRKLESKQLAEELIKKTKEASVIVEKNHKTKSVELIRKVNGSEKMVEDETAKYERQLHRQIEELQHLSSPNDTTTPPTSDGETSSSGGREVQRIIRNEAVARRRQAALARQQKDASKGLLADLQKSKSHSAVPCPGAVPVLVLPQQDGTVGILSGLKRSSTQPLTDGELRDKDSMSGASIAERLAALQKSGNNDWRKRLSRLNPEEDLTIICNTTQFNHHYTNHEHHEQTPSPPRERATSPGSGILADRLGKLDAATQGWRKRVGPTDAVQFSVAGRMSHKTPPPSPLLQHDGERKRRTPRARSFRSKAVQLKEVASTPSSPQKDLQISFKRSISAPGGDDENDLSLDRPSEMVSGPKVTVPRADDETFTSFFSSSISTVEKSQSDERLDIRDEDLDSIVSSSSQLLVQKRTVRVQRKVNPSRNPLKALAARTDLQDAYVDIRTGVAEKELKRLKVEKLAKHSSLAVEALAGLASKEDFTAISLKKASALSGAMLPYKELMLLQVKGRRHVQTRLVEPVASSINSGDNYVLITPTEVYNYIGRYSNVIEQSRGAEVAQHIQQTKDLGCSGARQVITVSEDKQTCSSSQAENFWKLLGSSSREVASAGHPDEDELYESAIIASNMVYELQGEELVPMTEYWGTIPKIEMLDPSKVLVFDFGSEMYVWSGKNATMEMRRMAQGLTRELWAEGYDYSECDVCPLNVAAMLGQRNAPSVDKSSIAAPARPTWALLAKVNQHMETVLFREKFLNWPDFSRVIRAKRGEDEERQVDASIDVQPCDAQMMLDSVAGEPDLELENSHVGRGSQYFDEETHRHFEIKTADVKVWHITEYEHEKLPSSSVGQFHAGDSYVVRWLYSMTVTGRELSGQPSRHCTSGRDRCAYFCWQGSEASLNEQGAAALLTVELDQERGPQVRVVQGMEPPAFLALFRGHMTVHAGKREDQPDKVWRLYMSRGELPHEGVLVEVPSSMRHLRSRASLILLNTQTGLVFVWHGMKSQPHTRQIALTGAQHLKSKPDEFGFHPEVIIEIKELQEGMENSIFFQALGGANRQLYVSLMHSKWPCDTTPRLFHLSSVSGTFCFTEVLGPYRNKKSVTSFPFLQSDLYSASQPALFLLDNKEELWLWQGWWPEQKGDDSYSDARGSGCVRWQAERRAAMQTALDYWKLQYKDRPLVAYLVWAGLEPLTFTNLFPIWNDRDDIAELNIRDGRKPGEVLKVEEELARLTRSTYPAAQLLQRPLPDGVDPTRLELYLNPEHFQELLGMTKEEFLELPAWKQTKLKKEVGLF